MILILAACTGGFGAVLRFLVDGAIARRHTYRFPLGTVVINVTGALLLGIVTGLALRFSGLEDVRTIVGGGLLGGYTTFSTASVEGVRIAMQDGQRATVAAAVHAGGMLAAGICAGALGLWLVSLG